ncbi:unnamed protein product [Nesidiocoris tenuis]|uniref:Uncharacterized protein n=1 Tax=Nesidiocoris tenuis TaxID=355587 RepID=A0A6H5HD79_9HEMI|nr:unnamed protein product [Nesidiocoris tenuis]
MFVRQQLRERRLQIALVAVPPDAKLLRILRRRHLGDGDPPNSVCGQIKSGRELVNNQELILWLACTYSMRNPTVAAVFSKK